MCQSVLELLTLTKFWDWLKGENESKAAEGESDWTAPIGVLVIMSVAYWGIVRPRHRNR